MQKYANLYEGWMRLDVGWMSKKHYMWRVKALVTPIYRGTYPTIQPSNLIPIEGNKYDINDICNIK